MFHAFVTRASHKDQTHLIRPENTQSDMVKNSVFLFALTRLFSDVFDPGNVFSRVSKTRFPEFLKMFDDFRLFVENFELFGFFARLQTHSKF